MKNISILLLTMLMFSSMCSQASELNLNIGEVSLSHSSNNVFVLEQKNANSMSPTAKKFAGGTAGALVGALLGAFIYKAIFLDSDCDPNETRSHCPGAVGAVVIGMPLGAIVGAITGVKLAGNRKSVSLSKSFHF